MDEFAKRRKALLKQLPKGAAVALPAAMSAIRNDDCLYRFRQNSHFLYLTGFSEPAAIAVLIAGDSQQEYVMFCEPNSREQEIWEGRHAGPEEAVHDYGADAAYPLADFERRFPRLIKNCSAVYWGLGERRDRIWLAHLKRLCATVGKDGTMNPIEGIIDEMRVRKSAYEIKQLKQSARIAAQAHCQAMRVCRPDRMEYEIEGALSGAFRSAGAVAAYLTIAGGGANACILHYIRNDQPLNDGDLLLVDAGAEYRGYASDITRTYPVNGTFSAAQRELYDLVLEAQRQAISKVRAGNRVSDFHRTAVACLTRGLRDLGLLKGSLNKLLQTQAYRKFYMHNTGHWLGMDVHDPGAYQIDGRPRRLEQGMVLTVEPGLYIKPSRDIPKRWWNTGIRIEDDVLVGRKGPEVISDGVPKEAGEIEKLMRG